MDDARDDGWRDWPLAYYLGFPAASNSGLLRLRKSPLHYKHEQDNPTPPTEAMILGAAMHSAILEPDLFHDRYTLASQCEALYSSGKRKGQQCQNPGLQRSIELGWLCGQHARGVTDWEQTKTVLPPETHALALGMMDAVWAHPKARAFLEAAGHVERSLLWTDSATGLRCKIRPDKLADRFGADVSLKTARDASEGFFHRELYTRGYFHAGAFYRRGLQAAGFDWRHRVEIVVENEPPHAVAVYTHRQDVLDAGDKLADHLLAKLARCVETDSWPGYPVEVTEIGIPAWAWAQIDEETAQMPQEVAA